MHPTDKSLHTDTDKAPCIARCTSRRSLYRILFYIFSFVLFFILVYPISPLYDDWYYLTAPNPNFTTADLLPGDTFWRPIDALFGALMSYIPSLFPALNRAVVILAHVLCAVLSSAILRELNINRKWRAFAVCFFLFSSAAWAVTTSPDAINQSYSVLFGLIAIYEHQRRGGYSYLFWCVVALLTKESGVSWFFVIVVLDAVKSAPTLNSFLKDKKLLLRAVKQSLIAFAVIGVYFALRFSLYGSITLGGSSGRYDVSVFSLSTIKNLVLLFASGASGVDSIALLSSDRSLPLAALTIILSLVFITAALTGVISMLKSKKDLFTLSGLLIIALGLAAPLTILGSAGEMHAYPVLFAMTLLYAFCLEHAHLSAKKTAAALLCIFLSFAVSSVHKLTAIYDYSERTAALTQSLKESYDTPNGRVLFIGIDKHSGYSVFDQSALVGTSYGLSLRPYYDWAELDHSKYLADSEEDALDYAEKNSDKYESIFIIRGETAERIK